MKVSDGYTLDRVFALILEAANIAVQERVITDADEIEIVAFIESLRPTK